MSRFIMLLAAIIAAVGIALAPGPALAQELRSITVAANSVFHGDVASVSQSIVIAGMVEGDVTSWSGSITVLGTVNGDVVSYVGSIELGSNAHVTGNVFSMSGGVQHDTGAQVAGRLLGEKPLAGASMMADVATIFQPRSAVSTDLPLPLMSAMLTLMILLLTVACTALWPMRTRGVSRALIRAPSKSLFIGLLTTVLAVLMVFALGGLLALSLVGLPLLLPLILLLQLPYLFGLAGLGRTLGEYIRPGAAAAPTAAAGVALLLLPLGVIGAVSPFLSVATFYVLASVGLGAAILSRGGSYSLRGRVV